jgi:hypothetical protein
MQQCVTIVIGWTGYGTLIFDSQKGGPTKIASSQISLDMALPTHTRAHTHTEGVQMEIFLYISINVYFTLQQTIGY